MSLSRRAFVKTMGVGGAGLLTTQLFPSREMLAGWAEAQLLAAQANPLLLHNNENPLGPGRRAIDAMRAFIGDGKPAGRYAFALQGDLVGAIAKRFSVEPDNVLTGAGSTQVLVTAVNVFTSASKPLVTAWPSYEECDGHANVIGSKSIRIPLTSTGEIDLNALADASKGAGLVFLNNPNNPTATVHSYEAVSGFIDRILTASPDTTILVDEAYHDYVTNPAHKTQIPTALQNPRVIVARTFSKAHGMAGLRVGYGIAHPDTIKKLSAVHVGGTLNALGMTAGTVSILDRARLEQEAARNTEARQFTIDWFKEHGFSSTDSQCNFIFVDVKRPVREFRDACRKENVLVGRDFPPFTNYARVSIGTIDEMRRAVEVFGRALGVAGNTAAAA